MTNTKSTKDPFFIFYDSRSGSTYLAKSLAEKANICIPPETNFVTSIISHYGVKNITNKGDIDTLCKLISLDRKFSDWNIKIEDIAGATKDQLKNNQQILLREFFLSIFKLFIQKNNIKDIAGFGIKKGSYITYFKQLKEVFPRAKFIHLIRDGRAVFNSKKNNIYSVTGKPFETDPCKAARIWKKSVELSRYINYLYPDSSIIIYYEDLILNPDFTLKRIADFLNISIIKSVPQSQYQVPERYGELHSNIEKEPLKNRINSWKTSLQPQEIEQYEAIAGTTLTQENYLLSSPLYKRLYNKLLLTLDISN